MSSTPHRLIIASLLALAACDRPMNKLEVVVVDPGPIAAEAYLCGRPPEPLPWKTDRYLLLRPADCRGAGRVVVRFQDRAPVTCPVKIVIAGTPAWYLWRLEDGRCVIR